MAALVIVVWPYICRHHFKVLSCMLSPQSLPTLPQFSQKFIIHKSSFSEGWFIVRRTPVPSTFMTSFRHFSISVPAKYSRLHHEGFQLQFVKTRRKATRDFNTLTHSHMFYPSMTKPTRVSSSSATLIDFSWSSNLPSYYSSGIIHTSTSDHFR